MSEKDYVLGTHEEELLRLGLQHRVWRPVVLDCWQKAGITAGKRILDLGAGPGYAALDLAEIVGPSGEVVALERSDKFVAAMRESFRRRGLSNARIYELDLMTGDLPKGNYDFSWCRWVLSFVSDQALLIKKLVNHAERRYLHLSRIRSLWNMAVSSTDPESGKVSRARHRNLAGVGRRAGWRGRSPAVALAKWIYYSVGYAAYLLCASD